MKVIELTLNLYKHPCLHGCMPLLPESSAVNSYCFRRHTLHLCEDSGISAEACRPFLPDGVGDTADVLQTTVSMDPPQLTEITIFSHLYAENGLTYSVVMQAGWCEEELL